MEAPEEEMVQQDNTKTINVDNDPQLASHDVDDVDKLNFKYGIRKTTKNNLEGLRKNLNRILEGTKDLGKQVNT